MRRRELLSALTVAGLLKAADVPRPCPDFTVNMPGGARPVQLKEYRGRVVMVEFLLTYCSHCQRASRSTDLVYRELGPKGFQPIGIAVDPGDTQKFVRDLNLSYPVGSAPQPLARAFLQLSSVSSMLMPQAVFVDRSHVIREQLAGNNAFFGEAEERNIREMVEKLLKATS